MPGPFCGGPRPFFAITVVFYPPRAGGVKHPWVKPYIIPYHYGYTPLPGAQLRHLAFSGPQMVAVLGFGAAAWKVAPRDRFIGWNAAARARIVRVTDNTEIVVSL